MRAGFAQVFVLDGCARTPQDRTMSDERGVTVWLTGLPCSGKTTLARQLEAVLVSRGVRVQVLDGDELRAELGQGLGFSRADRDINVHRIGYLASLLTRHGVWVIVAAVSPYAAARREVRQRLGRFVEVFVDCPLAECERRDVKGMYARARAGQIPRFTGVDDPYEVPAAPEVRVDTQHATSAENTCQIVAALEALGYLAPASSSGRAGMASAAAKP